MDQKRVVPVKGGNFLYNKKRKKAYLGKVSLEVYNFFLSFGLTNESSID